MANLSVIKENSPKQFQNLDRYEARKQILKQLSNSGFLIKEEKAINYLGLLSLILKM